VKSSIAQRQSLRPVEADEAAGTTGRRTGRERLDDGRMLARVDKGKVLTQGKLRCANKVVSGDSVFPRVGPGSCPVRCSALPASPKVALSRLPESSPGLGVVCWREEG